MSEFCLSCLETLEAWADIIGYDPHEIQEMVKAHPIEPYKSWHFSGKGNHQLKTSAYRCPRCGKSWKRTQRVYE